MLYILVYYILVYYMVEYIRTLKYHDLLFASIGHIIGAGIFTLIGYIHKYSQQKTWLSILLGGLFMFIISNTYSKLPTKFNDTDNLEYEIIKNKFGSNISHFVIICAIIGGIFGAYLVAKSFGNYFNDLTGLSTEISTIFIIGLCYLINISNISLLININNIITIIGLGILILIIFVGLYVIIIDKNKPNFTEYFLFKDYNDFKKNIWNIIKGAYLIIFSYFGFETLVKLNKESVNPQKDIPAAINDSMIIIIIIYTLFGFIYAYSKQLQRKQNVIEKDIPITNMVENLTKTNKYNKIITITSCVFTANTVLFTMLGISRLLDNEIQFDINKNIPRNAILIITLGILILYWFKISITQSTYVSNTLTILLFCSVIIAFKSLNNNKIIL